MPRFVFGNNPLVLHGSLRWTCSLQCLRPSRCRCNAEFVAKPNASVGHVVALAEARTSPAEIARLVAFMKAHSDPYDILISMHFGPSRFFMTFGPN
jgi:hypothetical protein